MNPASQLNICVIGLGKMGVMHCAMSSALPQTQLCAVVDRDAKLGKQLRSMGADAPYFNSVEAMLNSVKRVDAAILATPQFTHRALGEQCLAAGLHVLTEKPLAHTLADAEAMAAAAAKHADRITAIGFMKGHYPLWIEAARRLKDGWIGEPESFKASVNLSQVFKPMKGWTFTKDQAGGGVLINTGIHLVHLLTMLFGPDAHVISAEGGPVHSAVEDRITAIMQFPNGGPHGTYSANWSVEGFPTEATRVDIEGDAGRMSITDDWLRHSDGTALHRSEFDRAAFNASPDYGGEGWYNQLEDFAQAIIQDGRTARYDWQYGLAVQRIVDAMYRKLEG
ncbi:Gfo/Idh/MocA family oxidoreductase [Candidatus Sumerlaeota bacterium]|nr:Gfo/Idh/MocA family oxidoreductase [Candidatus Sumerlaeota bacterium]